MNESIPGDYQYRALHFGPVSQRRWHQAVISLVEKTVQGHRYRRICDLGCGSGCTAQRVSRIVPHAYVHAVDINPACIRFARERFGDRGNLKFQVADILKHDFSPGAPFDFVYATEVIEHFRKADLRAFLRTLRRIGHAETRYLITTPDYRSLWPLLEWALDLSGKAARLRGEQHMHRFTRKTLHLMLHHAGFDVLRMGNLCGVSPFLAHLSGKLADRVEEYENRLQWGHLIYCVFRQGGRRVR